jgi:hypothetical protein
MSQKIHFNFKQKISRRTLLRGAGVSMAIPWLSAMESAFATAAEKESPKRFVAFTLGLGLHAENLNPKTAGRDYEPSRYLKAVDDLRDRFTVISGSSHPGVSGGHTAEASILTANPGASKGRAKNTISIEQYMAKHLGEQTRFPSLVLSSSGSNSPSYTENGAMIPAESSPSRLFDRMFVDDSPAERKLQAARVREGRSIMDLVGEDVKRLKREVGNSDQQRLEAYFSSIRDLEKRMAQSELWAKMPKPKVDAKRPVDIRNRNDFVGQQRLMSDMIRLALETDSTRFIAYHLGSGSGVVPLEGVDEGYHSLSHHGLDEDKLEQLSIVETDIIRAWGEFLRSLDQADESGGNLLEQTTILLTSNLGNASNHSNQNMPVLVAGGGFKHGQHLAFDQRNNYPLSNLFVSALQRVGLEEDSFSTGKGTMSGLE